MKKIEFSKYQLTLFEKAVRYMISDLQYERHQALAHGCAGGSYDKEIEEYKQLENIISNARSAND
ncbi:hypothetical protein [Prevotella sp. tc2-28]|uniref:hypothetical protein n=1 Tax=Prevotella sp. tc2-28 TaxID=1761888 RepID=UPI000B85E904|nr:hypothetical protein [Prevotella sp. tc2-28]